MDTEKIVCPYCKREIPLSEAIFHPIEERYKKQYETEMKKKDEEIARREKEVDKIVTDRVKAVRSEVESEVKKKSEEENSLKFKDLLAQNQEKSNKITDMEKRELELLKLKRESEDKARSAELEMQRKLDEERKKTEETAFKRAIEEHQQKDAEKDKQMADLRKQIEELKRKSEQGSIQTQGEVWEERLEEILRGEWPEDTIEPVATGTRGADILQKVNTPTGKFCGMIYHECKNAKNWGNDWIAKLKNDQREIKADIALIVSTVLPKEVKNFALIDKVWVTNYDSFIGLVSALRISLIEVANAKTAATGKGEKMEMLYNYFSGKEFRHRVEAIVESFMVMQDDLNKERAHMERAWAKREKQIQQIIKNTSGMYGDLQGIAGSSLPEIKQLDLKALADESDEKDEDK